MRTRLLLDIERLEEELLVRVGGPLDRLAVRELRDLLRALLSDPEDDRSVRVLVEPAVLADADVVRAVAAAGRLARTNGRRLLLGYADVPSPPEPPRLRSRPEPPRLPSPLLDDLPAPRRQRAGHRQRVALAVLLYGTAALALAVPVARGAMVSPTSGCPYADTVPVDVAGEARAAWAVRCLVNAERAAAGRRSLLRDEALGATAGGYAHRLVAEQFFSHVAPDEQTLGRRLREVTEGRRAGFRVGENLAWGDGARATPRATVTAWMQSAGHRAVMLQPEYVRMGTGVAAGSPRGARPTPAATYVLQLGVWGLPGRAMASSLGRAAARAGRAGPRAQRGSRAHRVRGAGLARRR